MFTQFFGQFLLNESLITPQELNKVFRSVRETRLKLGTIAIHEGFLDAQQVETINNLQKKQDKRFGEIAVEHHLLTEDQLNHILSKQQSEHLVLAQAIVDQGYMTLEEFKESIEVYKRLHGISNDDFESLKDGRIESVIYNVLNIDDDRIKAYVTLFYKNLVRFITNDVHVCTATRLNSKEKHDFLFEQVFHGDQNLYTAFTGHKEFLIPFAEKYANEKMDGMDDYTIDVCKEFLNLHNGLFSVNMSNEGHKLNLNIQKHHVDHVLEDTSLYKILFFTELGMLHLIIGTPA